ncbi:MAG: type II secretion system F family protein [Desulfobacterales bacterium]
MSPLSLIAPFGYLLFFCAILFMVYSLAAGARQMAGPQTAGADDFEIPEAALFILMFRPFYRIFTPLIEKLPIPGYKARMKRYATIAGIESQADGNDIIGFQITIMLLFMVMAYIYFHGLFAVLVAGAAGLGYPYLWLYEKKKQRQEAIRLSMPDIIDMLSLSVEAGLSFNAAVQKVCDVYRHDKDPFVVELYLMDQNISLGRSRDEALKIMAERVELAELDSFTSILIQANKMGSSIAETLKAQAERMRAERFLNAERIGAQASQKLLIPMMIFIFPIIFIVIFGPYVVKMVMG